MQQLNPDGVMASLHSDHFIADEEGFRQALLAAEEVARQGYLVTLGVTPTKPETGYGYVESGEEIGEFNGYAVHHAKKFLKKPDLDTAERFLASGRHYWNSGIFIWQISTLIWTFSHYLPDFYGQLNQMGQALIAGESIDPIWKNVIPVSIDMGIMEQAEKVAVVPLDVGWNDVGSRVAIHEINQVDENDNVIHGPDILVFDTQGSLIQSSRRLIATIGLENIIIIDTGDALVVCAKDKAQDIKKVVNWLEENNRFDLL